MTYYSTREILVKGNKKVQRWNYYVFYELLDTPKNCTHNEGKMQLQEMNNPLNIKSLK